MTAGTRRSQVHAAVFLAAVCGGLVLSGWSSAAAQNVFERAWTDLLARPSGPLAFRFVLQPTMAAIAAIMDGLKDARTGRSPYFWTVLANPAERMERLREGLRSTSRIIVLGLVMDAAYQIIVFRTFYPVEAVVIAIALAFVPYLLIRGPAARIARLWQKHAADGGTSR